MRRALAVLVLATTLGLGGGVTVATDADAQPEGAVAVCNWEDFDQWGHGGYNWRWMGCNFGLLGRVQCRGEDIPRCWTATEAKRKVRAFRAYLGIP